VIVVADTTPLNYLIQLGHADLLRHIYGRVVVPSAVMQEMQHPEARQIAVTGTFGILLQAALRGYLDFPETIQRLRLLGFWVSPATEAAIMQRYLQTSRRK